METEISGAHIRPFAGESDYAEMARVMNEVA